MCMYVHVHVRTCTLYMLQLPCTCMLSNVLVQSADTKHLTQHKIQENNDETSDFMQAPDLGLDTCMQR